MQAARQITRHSPIPALSGQVLSSSAEFVMPTFPGAAGPIPRPQRRMRAARLHPLPMNRAFGISLRDTGQGEVELDFRERCIQFLLFHLFRVFMADDLWDKPLARCESEVVLRVLVAGDVDLGR